MQTESLLKSENKTEMRTIYSKQMKLHLPLISKRATNLCIFSHEFCTDV